MLIRRGILWGLLAAAWVLLWFGVAIALLLPWWEHTGLVALDWAALLRRWVPQTVPLPRTVGIAIVQWLLLGAATGALLSALIRLLNDRGTVVEATLIWAWRAVVPAIPTVVAALLLSMTVALFDFPWFALAFVLALPVNLYLYFSCRQPTVVASAEGRGWWRPAFAPRSVLVTVVTLWICGLIVAFGLHLGEVFLGWTWLSGGIDLIFGMAASTLATLALVRRLDWRTLGKTLSDTQLTPVIRAVLDLELRLTLLALLAGVPLLVTALVVVFVLPQMEIGFREINQPLPALLYLAARLTRAFVDGLWIVPSLILLPFGYLAQGRLIWLLFAQTDATMATDASADLG